MRQTFRAIVAFFTAAAACALGQDAPRYYPITSQNVLMAMGARGLTTEGATVSLAAPIEATVENPVLDLISVTSNGDHSSQLLLACRGHLQCRSFYAIARWNSAGAVTTSASLSPARRASAKEALAASSADTTVKTGTRATLELDGERIHIRLVVICLENGTVGDTIRVSTPNRKQIFSAEIVEPGLTKARM